MWEEGSVIDVNFFFLSRGGNITNIDESIFSLLQRRIKTVNALDVSLYFILNSLPMWETLVFLSFPFSFSPSPLSFFC